MPIIYQIISHKLWLIIYEPVMNSCSETKKMSRVYTIYFHIQAVQAVFSSRSQSNWCEYLYIGQTFSVLILRLCQITYFWFWVCLDKTDILVSLFLTELNVTCLNRSIFSCYQLFLRILANLRAWIFGSTSWLSSWISNKFSFQLPLVHCLNPQYNSVVAYLGVDVFSWRIFQ